MMVLSLICEAKESLIAREFCVPVHIHRHSCGEARHG
jgi:hypothetical protein